MEYPLISSKLTLLDGLQQNVNGYINLEGTLQKILFEKSIDMASSISETSSSSEVIQNIVDGALCTAASTPINLEQVVSEIFQDLEDCSPVETIPHHFQPGAEQGIGIGVCYRFLWGQARYVHYIFYMLKCQK